jgi:hypothetical protein
MKKNKKGSTLLLAMVIISTVLFAGIGVATILSRQVKDIPAVENKAVAFYLAETIADMADKMDESEIENFDCDSFSHADWCDVEKVGDEYHVKIKVGNDHYKFVKTIGEGGVGSGGLLIRFKKISGWEDDITFIYRPMSGGSYVSGSVWKDLTMSSSEYTDWWEHNLQDIHSSADTIRVAFCQTSTFNGTASSCLNDNQYWYPFTAQQDSITLCKQKDDCVNQRAFSFRD